MLDVDYVTVTDTQADAACTDLAARALATTPSGAAGYAAWRAASVGGPALVILTEAPPSATYKGITDHDRSPRSL
ncbi:hypothetical protein FPZ24_02835 [Sphingomonas panacisoli]|uniref:Uncharacterized protein n=1 Tax=Sphingomonas panacisoli TaxID=1813879 RepID=A0A5B8LEH9_9SPHN|nr:hypothetical protein [Sphingomonas panacisoli]QDZ06537.1 hypothetical protein FPZ24_02835 [Sphingomonas panacisoli]